MIALTIKTNNNLASIVLRTIAFIVVFSHGAQAFLGWFGGAGLTNTLQALTTHMGLPYFVALLVILIQFFSPILLLLGFATRLAALSIFGIFVGMLTYHIQYGLHMNWMGDKPGEGYEFHLLMLAITGALLILGGGKFSIDRYITKIFPV